MKNAILAVLVASNLAFAFFSYQQQLLIGQLDWNIVHEMNNSATIASYCVENATKEDLSQSRLLKLIAKGKWEVKPSWFQYSPDWDYEMARR